MLKACFGSLQYVGYRKGNDEGRDTFPPRRADEGAGMKSGNVLGEADNIRAEPRQYHAMAQFGLQHRLEEAVAARLPQSPDHAFPAGLGEPTSHRTMGQRVDRHVVTRANGACEGRRDDPDPLPQLHAPAFLGFVSRSSSAPALCLRKGKRGIAGKHILLQQTRNAAPPAFLDFLF